MKKSVFGLTVAGVLLLGGFATTALANDDTTSSTGSKVENFMKGFKGMMGFGHKKWTQKIYFPKQRIWESRQAVKMQRR